MAGKSRERREGGGSEPFAFFKHRNPAMKEKGPFHTTDFYEMGQWPLLHEIQAAWHLSTKSDEPLDLRSNSSLSLFHWLSDKVRCIHMVQTLSPYYPGKFGVIERVG